MGWRVCRGKEEDQGGELGAMGMGSHMYRGKDPRDLASQLRNVLCRDDCKAAPPIRTTHTMRNERPFGGFEKRCTREHEFDEGGRVTREGCLRGGVSFIRQPDAFLATGSGGPQPPPCLAIGFAATAGASTLYLSDRPWMEEQSHDDEKPRKTAIFRKRDVVYVGMLGAACGTHLGRSEALVPHQRPSRHSKIKGHSRHKPCQQET